MTTLLESGPDVGDAGPPHRDPGRSRPRFRFRPRLNVLTGLIGAAIGYAIGHLLGNVIAGSYLNVTNSGQNDVALVLGYVVGAVGWLAGLGVLNYPLAKMIGIEEPEDPTRSSPGVGKYFRYTTEHKVVGVQYLFGMIFYFLFAGLLAMLIRVELLSPTQHVLGPGQYIQVVGEHGTMMMMMMTSVSPDRLGTTCCRS